MKIDSPNRSFNLYLISLLALNFVPHLEEHFIVILLFPGICMSWRWAYEFEKIRLPKFHEKIVLIFIVFSSVYLIYGEYRGMEVSTAALLAMVALKLLDNVRYRDAMVLLFTNYLLLLSAFLNSQSLAMTLFGGLSCILITALSFQLHRGREISLNFWKVFVVGAKVLGAVTPLLILLFFVFPRFSSGILGGLGQSNSSSGFSDQLSPGGIEKLVLSNELAFRVRFLGKEKVSVRDMYWRGAVFSLNQGLVWKRDEEFEVLKSFPQRDSEGDSYEIILEPIFGNWIFLLDTPKDMLFNHWRYYKNIKKSKENSFQWSQSISQRVLYKASSVKSYIEQLNKKEKEKYLKIPLELESDPELLKLVNELNEKKKIDTFSDNAMNWFGKEFKYSLNLKNNSALNLKDFIFKTKTGFCEHFAASFAFLSRMAGYPARVVTGFQGAKRNPLSDHYIVTQRNAHAWVELYDEKKGEWLRVDPTTVVAPLRFELGADVYYSFSQSEIESNKSSDQLLSLYNSNFALKVFRELELYVDLVSRRWNYFLLNYDFEAQKELFKNFGIKIENRKYLSLLSVVILIVFFLFVRLRAIRRGKTKLVQAQRLLQKLEVKLGKRLHIFRERGEAPLSFLLRLSETKNLSKAENFTLLYMKSMYSKEEIGSAELSEAFRLLSEELNYYPKNSG